MKWRNGPAGTMGLVAIARNYQGRTPVTLYHSSRCNSYHSPVPAIAVNHHTERIF